MPQPRRRPARRDRQRLHRRLPRARAVFAFATDHRAFLATVLPVGPRWPDWRHGDPADLQSRLAWPVDGALFDVEHAVCWFDGWGPRPESTVEAVAVARQRLRGCRSRSRCTGTATCPPDGPWSSIGVVGAPDRHHLLRHEPGGQLAPGAPRRPRDPAQRPAVAAPGNRPVLARPRHVTRTRSPPPVP